MRTETHHSWAPPFPTRYFGAIIFPAGAGNNEIAAKLGFGDTGTEAALRLRLADVGVHVQERIGTKELGDKK